MKLSRKCFFWFVGFSLINCKSSAQEATTLVNPDVNIGSSVEKDMLSMFLDGSGNKHPTTQKMNGTVVRLVAMEDRPFVNYLNFSREEEEVRGYSPGVVIEILRELQRNIDIQFELLPIVNGTWGAETSNGSWDGLVGTLQRHEADIGAGALIVRFDRQKAIDFSFPFLFSETAMLIRAPNRYTDNTFLLLTAPFKWQVWLIIGAFVLGSGIILLIFTRALRAAREVQYGFWAAHWVFFSVFVQQGLPIQPRSWTCRTMLAFWWLASLTLIATFTGELVALFAVEKIILPFRTPEGLLEHVESGGYTIVLSRQFYSRIDSIRQSEQQLYKRLWAQIQTPGKVIYVDTLEEGKAQVKARSGMVLLGPRETLNIFEYVDCDVVVLPDGLLPVWLSIPVAKNSPYKRVLSETVSQLVEKGFIQKWLQDYKAYLGGSLGQERCDSYEGISTKGFLGIDRAQGAFWIVLIGISLGISSLVSEFAYKAVRYLLPDKAPVWPFLRGQQPREPPRDISNHVDLGLYDISSNFEKQEHNGAVQNGVIRT